MTARTRFRLLLAVGLLLLGVTAATGAGFPHADSDLAPDPAVRYGTLDNGLRYALMANDTPPEVAAIRFMLDFGSLMEGEDERGLAHFIEHMAFNGTTNVPEGEMVKILERLGLAFGADTNASTGFETTVYELDLPSVDDGMLGTALMLLREIASEISFDAEAIDRERGVLLSELRVRNTPGFRAWVDGMEFLLPGARAVERMPGGLAQVIETAQPETFRDLYRRYYRPERATLVIVGDVDVDAVEERIRERFGDWRGIGEPGAEPARGEVSERGRAADTFVEAGITNGLTVATVTPWEFRPDRRAERERGYLELLGAGIVNRRLQRLSRAEDAPFLGASVGASAFARTAEIAAVRAGFAPGAWEPALRAVDRELRRGLEHGFSRAELDEQLANLRTGLENAVRGAATRNSYGLAGAISGALAGRQVFTHPADDLALFEQLVPEFTPERVHAAFREAWPALPGLLHATLAEPLDDGPESMLEALTAMRAEPVAAPAEQEELVFAYERFGEPGAVVSRERVEDLAFEQVVFDNGVRLNVKQTDFRDNQVLARVRLLGGVRDLPPALAGLDRLTGIGLISGGLDAHPVDDLQRLLAGHSVGASASLGESTLNFSGGTTPDDLALQFRVWTAYLTAPAYRAEAQAQYRRLIEGTYESIDTTPGGVAGRDVPRLLRSGDPRYGIPPRETLEARSLEELRSFLAPILGRAPIEVAIVGDVSPDRAIEVVAGTLGALPERAEPEPWELVAGAEFPAAETVTLRHLGPPDQALVLLYWPATDGSDTEFAIRMDLLAAVLQLRMTDTVREALGATYSPGVGVSLSGLYRGYGYLAARSEVAVADVERMVRVMADVVEGFADRPVTEDELKRARQPLLEGMETAQETNGYWLGVIDQAQGRPHTLTVARNQRRWLEATTPGDLAALARRYLVPEGRYLVRVLPVGAEGAAAD